MGSYQSPFQKGAKMDNNHTLEYQWIIIGIVAGLCVSAAYPLILFAPLPLGVTVFLSAVVGPLLALGSVGLYFFLKADRRTIPAQIGLFANIIAGTLFTTMLLVQIAIRSSKPVLTALHKVHLGLDVSWDVYIGLGTIFFAWAMLRHPRLGPVFALPGLLVGILVLTLNIWTFPTPPPEAGLFDVGPFVGIWYLAATLRIVTSLNWLKKSRD
jgi:hypothetical protein